MKYEVIDGRGIIPNSVTSIGSQAFEDYTSLQSIVIPDSVTVIGDEAFWGCSSLQSIVIPNSVTEIGKYAFFACKCHHSVFVTLSYFEVHLLKNGADRHHNPARLTTASNHREVCAYSATSR